jgi:hypothetical protein
MMQIGVFDKALVHKEILLATGLLGILCLDDIAFDTNTLAMLSNGSAKAEHVKTDRGWRIRRYDLIERGRDLVGLG